MRDTIHKSPADIDLELRLIQQEKSRQWRGLIANAIMLLISMILLAILFRSGFSTFPRPRTLFTSNAAAVCNFSPVSERGDVTDAIVRDFASSAVIDLHTLDYMNWRKTIDTVTSGRFTVEARAIAAEALRDSGILPAIIRNQFVLRPVPTDLPLITEAGVKDGTYQWTVQVPAVFAYTGVNATGKAEYRPENRRITVTISRTEITADHPEGLIVSSIRSSQAIAAQPGNAAADTATGTTTEPQPEGQ